MASNTLLELVRLKVFYFMLIFGLLMIGSSAFMVNLSFQEKFQVLKDVSLGAMTIFTWLLATLSTAMLLPKDVEDRTLYTILAKPVARLDYLLGKLLGVLLMLAIALGAMTVVFLVVLYVREQAAIVEAASQTAPSELAAEIAKIKASSFSANLLPGIAIIYLKACVVAALTLALSTFSTSWIFTIVMSMVFYFIGHMQGTAREYWLEMNAATAQSGPIKLLLATTALIFPDFQLFSLVDDIAVGNAVPTAMFIKTTLLGLGYVFIYTMVGFALFAKKEL